MPTDKHRFVIMINGELITYTKYEDIPEVFDHIVKFLPVVSKGPHTEKQHEEISLWNDKLSKLMKKERKNAGRM